MDADERDAGSESTSPLRAAATDATAEAVAVFELLSSETRLAILLALWETQDPTDDAGVSFSDLRERVGVADSGQFNYHLGKLEGVFVDSTAAGYRLRPGGLSVVRSVVAGTGSETSLPPTEIGVACHNCGAATRVAYEDGWLYHLCQECETDLGVPGHYDPDAGAVLFQEPLPPSILAGRTPEGVFAAGVFRLVESFRMKAGGLCPECSGPTELSVSACGTHDATDGACPDCGRYAPGLAEWDCSVCRFYGRTGPGVVGVLSAVATDFYHDRGVDLVADADDFAAAARTLSILREVETEVVATDPPEFLVTTAHDGDGLRLRLDADLRVTDSEVVTGA